MSNSECVFCGHGNTADARYCNQCGGLLELKRCDECDAINESSALSCAKCGAEIAGERDPFESIADARAYSRHASTDRWSSADGGHSVIDRLQLRVDTGAGEAVMTRVRPFRGNVTPLVSVARRVAHVVPVRVHEERARISLVNRVGVPLLLVAAVSSTVYWAYPPTARDVRTIPQSVRQSAAVTSTAATGAAGTFTPAAAVASADSSGSPVAQGRIRTTDQKGAGNASAQPAGPAIAVAPVSAESEATQKQADPAPIVARASKREQRDPVTHKQTPRPTDSSHASPNTSTLLMRASSGDAPPGDDRRSCTSEIAALGLCALRTDVER